MTEQIDLKVLIEDYNSYISRISSGVLVVVGNLRENNLKQALNEITNFVEGMNWLISVSNYLKMNEIAVDFDGDKIKEFFEEINEGLVVRDYFLVADLFEYEIAPYFSQLTEIYI